MSLSPPERRRSRIWRSSSSNRALVLSASLLLAHCSPALPHPPYSAHATSELVPIETGPPPGRVETIPTRPAGADAWVNGEWILRHGRWYWRLGRWVKTPEGATYSPWVLVRAADGTPFFAASVWRDPKGAVIAEPPALTFATAATSPVVSPEGEPEEAGRAIERPRPQKNQSQPANESPKEAP